MSANAPPHTLNPLLAFQPAYTYSMPTQLLIQGTVLTLLTVLIFHLIFTARYHYPLSRTNFILLLSAVSLTQISTIIVTIVVNHHLLTRSRFWPFMFDYVEVTMPPANWSTVRLAGWYIMQGIVTFLAHATHIQFLTLLFPSSLEQKLIVAFLGPLCLFSSSLFFTHFLADPNLQDLGDAVRNTATSTLSLLYTFGLLIWGYAVNRKRAWDHEGGTFGFGVLSISLAFGGTAANFIEVKEDRLRWLPWLVNTVLLWQSWAGFWWWVSAGMWSGEVAEIVKKEQKLERQQERKLRKRLKLVNSLLEENLPPHARHQPQARPGLEPASVGQHHSNSSVSRFGSVLHSGASVVSRRLTRGIRSGSEPAMPGPARDVPPIELNTFHQHESNSHLDITRNLLAHYTSSQQPVTCLSPPGTTESSTNDTTGSGGLFHSFPKRIPCVDRWISTLSEAHNAAARRQARTADEIRQTEQVRKWGIGAMTQRATLKQFQYRAATNSIGNSSRNRTNVCPGRCRAAGTSGGETDWTSAGEEEEELGFRSGPQRLQVDLGGGEGDPMQELQSPCRTSTSHRQEQDLCPPLLTSLTGLYPRGRRRRKEKPPREAGGGENLRTETLNERVVEVDSEALVHDQTSGHCLPGTSRSRGMRSEHGWAWKGPLVKARLRDVTSYD